jgi:excisionase family DNA binding protein
MFVCRLLQLESPANAYPSLVYASCRTRRITAAWAAEDYSGLGINTLYKLAHAGKIELVEVGGRTLVVRASIDAYLASLTPK